MEHNPFTPDGHLTDEAFDLLRSDAADELSRLEISEHLAFCDDCLDRYAAFLTPGVLAEPSDLLRPGIFARIRQKSREIFVNRYLSAGVAACLALTLWTAGIFDFSSALERLPAIPEGDRLETLTETTAGVTNALTDSLRAFFDSIRLRGVYFDEKK